MTNSQTTDRTDPVTIIWLVGAVLVIAGAVIGVVGLVSINGSTSLASTEDITKAATGLIIGALFFVTGLLTLVGGLVARAVQRG